jgi:ATP-dependent helicase/nuclease subunit A
LTGQVALLDQAHVSTLHGFCLDLVRRHFHALGLDPQFSVLDEAQTKPLIHTVLDELLLQHYASDTTGAKAVRELIRIYGQGSDEPIRTLVIALHQHTQTLAAPNQWFATQQEMFARESPDHWREQLRCAVREWAAEWAEVMAAADLTCSNLAASHAALTRLRSASCSLTEVEEQLTALVEADEREWPNRRKTELRKPFESCFTDAGFLRELADRDGAALRDDWTWTRTVMGPLLGLAQEFGTAFSAAKRELGGIDFADQEQFALRLLYQPDGEPTSIARECRDQFRQVFVDECQDINAAQDAIIRAVSRTGVEANRFLVGDVKQSIYRFRLADPRIFQGYQQAWKDAPGTKPAPSSTGAEAGRTLSLTDNFRSAEGLLAFVNSVFRTLMRPNLGGLDYDREAELKFGAAETRAALKAAPESPPRVELHVITRDAAESGATDPEEPAVPTGDVPELQTTEREARLVAAHFKQLKQSGFPVWDAKTGAGGFRPVEFGDMVVLLRGISGRAEIFAKAFHQAGVPLRASRGGFLSAQEVRDVLNLLRLLDNPRQDLPLLAVLRSPLVGLSAPELVQIRCGARKELFWQALQKARDRNSPLPASLRTKVALFLEQIGRWREVLRHTSLTDCLELALVETHYEALLQADVRGPERVANLRRLVDLARRFDPFQREGLFRFLQFIAEQEEAEVNHAPAEASSGNAVRLLTIHASKGLEFPVVALAGLGVRFNLRDLSCDVLLDPDAGLSPKVFPPHARTKYPSIAHWAAARRERRAQLGEELRLLYVALTRARDAALLVGTASRRDEVERWQQPAPLTDHARLKAANPLDWLRLWFNRPGAESDWTGDREGRNEVCAWKFWESNDPLFAGAIPGRNETGDEVPRPTSDQVSAIQQRVAFRYPHALATGEPAKTTVTALRRRAVDDADDEAQHWFSGAPRTARLTHDATRLSAAEIGTAHHLFQQHVSLARTATEMDLRNEAHRLSTAGVLTAAQAAALDFKGLHTFWQSALARELRALPAAAINREMPFTARFSVTEIKSLLRPAPDEPPAPREAADEFVIVQGTADLAALLPEEIWLVDFKTDHVAGDDLPQNIAQYEPQLRLYALALSRTFRRPVTRACLHYLSAGETVSIRV